MNGGGGGGGIIDGVDWLTAEFVDDVVALGNCCHGGGTAAVETAGRGIGGGTDDGNCPTLPGGNLGGVGGNCVHGGGPDSRGGGRFRRGFGVNTGLGAAVVDDVEVTGGG